MISSVGNILCYVVTFVDVSFKKKLFVLYPVKYGLIAKDTSRQF